MWIYLFFKWSILWNLNTDQIALTKLCVQIEIQCYCKKKKCTRFGRQYKSRMNDVINILSWLFIKVIFWICWGYNILLTFISSVSFYPLKRQLLKTSVYIYIYIYIYIYLIFHLLDNAGLGCGPAALNSPTAELSIVKCLNTAESDLKYKGFFLSLYFFPFLPIPFLFLSIFSSIFLFSFYLLTHTHKHIYVYIYIYIYMYIYI